MSLSTVRVMTPGCSQGGWRAVWRYRQLWRSLTLRNLRIKYQRSALGFVWTLLNPLLTVAVLATVFRYIVKVPLPHYVAFLLSGYFAWNFILQTLSAGTYVLAEHAQLSRSAPFPKEIPVLAAISSRLVEFALELGLVLLGLGLTHHHGIPSSVVWLPWLVAMQVLLAFGLLCPIASLSVYYRDVQHILPIALTLLFYASPVFYPARFVPEALQSVYLANPVAQLLTAYHVVLYDGQAPPLSLVATLTAASCGIAGVGYALFNRAQADIAEVV